MIVLPSPREPVAVARAFLANGWTTPEGVLLLRHWRGGFWSWQKSCWREYEPRAVRGLLYDFTEDATYLTADGPAAWQPNRNKIDDLIDALASICLLPADAEQPVWLDGRTTGTIIACANGLLDVGTRHLLPHDPNFFNITAVPFAYNPATRVSRRWRRFLKAVLPRDSEARKSLAQWYGYIISGRLDLQKMYYLVGEPRGGKGITGRILGALIGSGNVAAPTLADFASEFGLAPLVGKSLAIIPDARLFGQSSRVVERLLSISGEDKITANRKYREAWSGKLSARIMLLSNELPQFSDASAAIVHRFIVIVFGESFLGREDLELEDRLREELPGILTWALMGLAQLERKGRFTQPKSAEESIATLLDLVSPLKTFLRECCEFDSDYEVEVNALFKAHRAWSDENGHSRLAKSVFGKNLRAAIPRLKVKRPRKSNGKSGNRERVYSGLRLTEDAKDNLGLTADTQDKNAKSSTSSPPPCCAHCGAGFEAGPLQRCFNNGAAILLHTHCVAAWQNAHDAEPSNDWTFV
jgi:putative DNA primase/helicase